MSGVSDENENLTDETPHVSPLLAKLVDLLESRYRVPGTNLRFGLDAVVGLIPGFGDFAGMLIGAALMFEGWRQGASWWLLGTMLLNLWIDAVIGSIPVLGDAFDFYYKANRRNLKLLENHLAARG